MKQNIDLHTNIYVTALQNVIKKKIHGDFDSSYEYTLTCWVIYTFTF